MKKRLFAFAMSVCLILTIFPVTALAASDDITPPVVTGIYMNSPGVTVTVGDTLYFDIEVEDESEITDVMLGFSSVDSNGIDITTAYAYLDSYDAESHIAKAVLEVKDSVPSATWEMSYIRIEDYYGNYFMTSKSFDNVDFKSVTFTVTGTSGDITPPIVKSVIPESQEATVTVGDTLYFDIEVEEESVITDVMLGFSPVDSNGIDITTAYAYLDSYDAESHIAKAVLEVKDSVPSATWEMSYIRIEDYYGNYFMTSKSFDNVDFKSVTFTVTGTSGDITPPIVKSVIPESQEATVTVGDTLYFDIEVEEESEIRQASLGFSPVDSSSNVATVFARLDTYDAESHIARVALNIKDSIPSTTWEMSYIRIEDYYGNHFTTSKSFDNVDFMSITFTVASSDVQATSVSLLEAVAVPVRSVYTLRPTVEPLNALPDFIWTSSDETVAAVMGATNGLSAQVIAYAPGTATVTGTTQNGLTASCQVTVTDAPLPESGEIDRFYSVGVDCVVTIVPVLTPKNATTFYEVTSDNPHVASAKLTDNGTGIRVQGVNAGHATVTVRTSNGIVMTTAVTVGKETDVQHEKKTYPGYEPTCARSGRTDEVRCSACWYVFTPSEEIPATGRHTFGEWQVEREPTATEEGLRVRYCEVCYTRETESIPATGDGGSSTGSSGSTGGGSASNVGQSATVQSGDQDLSATVKDGAISVTATDSEVSSMIDSAAGGVVELDASAVDVADVRLSQNIIDAISGSDASGLSVKTAQGSVELSGAVVDTLTDAMTGKNDTLTLTVDTVDPASIPDTQKYPIASVLKTAAFVELSATVEHRNDSGSVTSAEKLHELGGQVTVSVPFELSDSMKGRQIVACYIADDGSITYFPVKYENGVATFTTTHFSTYGIVESYAAAFKDVNVSAWYMLSLEYAMEHGLMGGVSSDEFAPEDSATRGMIATVLYRLEGEPAVTGMSVFADVAPGLWYTDAVTWAAERGVLQGHGNGLCGPKDPVTREQMAVLLWRYADEPKSTADLSLFPDAGKVSAWADTAVRWAVETGIINGKDGNLVPGGTASRAEIATMLMRFRETVLGNG